MTLEEFESRLRVDSHRGNGFMAHCPAHKDDTASLSVSDGGDRILLKCWGGCDYRSVVQAMGLEVRDLWYETTNWSQNGSYAPRDVVAEYVYTDAEGVPLYTRARYASVGEERKILKTHYRKVLYRLPELIVGVKTGEQVYFVEGEKDVESLRSVDKIATTSGGTGSFKPEHALFFRKGKVIVVADKDEAGFAFARDVCAMLYPYAEKILLTCASVGKDVSDHLEAGLPLSELIVLQEVK